MLQIGKGAVIKYDQDWGQKGNSRFEIFLKMFPGILNFSVFFYWGMNLAGSLRIKVHI